MGKAGSKPQKKQNGVTFAQAWRDVMIKAMTTGQLLPITISIILMIAAWRIPADELAKVAHRIIDGLIDHSLWGYISSAVLACAWSWHAATMRKCFSAEAKRMGMEKTFYQQSNTRVPLGTSDN
ncbi:hypothetical protein GBN33_05455 [Plesiomonas shigelloides]|uniref:hypothetical protein n=1 Tax=Plesiomonas shigelloides TaxID=703 RepID=UPI0012622BF2|nr:hypothetical protein [Plesiomonas shigelloides]KAB7700399.1 hypothetical protein GBN33_05455 [Plesiomonas shigelloides]